MSAEAVIWHDLECGGYSADLPYWHALARRSGGTVLTYDPQDRTLRVGDPRHAVRHYRQEALTLTHARTSERRTVQGRRKTREHPLRPEAERG